MLTPAQKTGQTLRLGYCCINTLLPSSNRTCRLERATPERLLELAQANLTALEGVLAWNVAHGIRLFRISSEVIPFGSHPVNTLPWWDLLKAELERIGSFIRNERMRVSMHPGQYTVLNSLRPEVVESSRLELEYHARFLASLGLDETHKIVLHLGGAFGDKVQSMERFVENFSLLSPDVQRRLVVENDEKLYSLTDVLSVAQRLSIPVVFDVFHYSWLPSFEGETLTDLLDRAAATWGVDDGPQKIHYSDPWPGKPPGSHSQTVDVEAFAAFYRQVQGRTLDIMLEVKDKQESVLKLYERFPDLRAL